MSRHDLGEPLQKVRSILSLPSGKEWLRTVLALLLPVAVLGVQWALWDFLRPYAWFLFYPAVFISAWLGGLRVGLMASVLSTGLAWWFLVPPMYGFVKEPRQIVPGVTFLAMSLMFVAFQERLRRAHHQAGTALAVSRQANARLREVLDERMIFFALVDNSSDFIGLADTDGKPVYLNPAGRRMVGLGPEHRVEDTRLSDYYAPEMRPFASDVIFKEMFEEGRWRGETFVRNWQTQAAIPVSDEHFIIRDPESGRALGMGTIIRDVSEIKRARDEVEAANQRLQQANAELRRHYERATELDQLKTRLFANVSHELRTPLTLILGPTQRLLDALDTPEPMRHDLDVIARNARMLLRHVNDLLDVTKLEAASMHVEHAETDFSRLARFVASHFEVLAQEKHIAYTLDVPEGLAAQLDANKLQRVLLNLLSNAFKFTPPEGRVRLGVSATEGQLQIDVADSGPGIPPDKRAVIFERFQQLEGGATRRFGGTGLGLSIVRDFIALHRGTIEVERAPEGGALFRVSLPRWAPEGVRVERASEASAGAEEARQMVAELRGTPAVDYDPRPRHRERRARVLVVEDNPEMNQFISENLATSYEVTSVFDGRQGLQKALELEPDLVLSDMMMPELSGDELVRAIRSHAALARTAIVMLTAKADDELRVRLLRSGAQDYLMKPFSVEELRSRIDNLLVAKRAIELELRLSSLVAQAPDGIIVTDPDGRCIEVNDAACRMIGDVRERIIGRTSWDMIVPEQHDRFPEWLERLARGETVVAEWLARRPDGSTLPVEISARALPDGRRQAFVRDISERKAAARALEASEAKYRQIVSSAAEAIISVDESERVTQFNAAAERVFGWTAEEMLNQPVERLLPGPLRAVHQEHLRAFAASGTRSRPMTLGRTVPALRRNGEEFPAQASIAHLVDHGQHVFTVVLRDMSSEVRVLEREQFLSEISAVLASSLDVEVTLRELGQRAVRYLGEVCLVDVARDGASHHVHVATGVPDQAGLVDGLERLSAQRDLPRLADSVWRTQQPLLVTDVRHYLESEARAAEYLSLLQSIGPRSLIAVPMLARGCLLGVLIVISTRRTYDRLDLHLAADVAGRAATALDNASLHTALLRANADIRARLHELQEAQARIRTLTGLLPVCAWCGRVRDETAHGAWKGLEQYVAEHSSAQVSHGICPECVAKHFASQAR